MKDDKREGWVKSEAYLFAGSVERVTVTESYDSQRIFDTKIVGMEVAVCNDRVEVSGVEVV